MSRFFLLIMLADIVLVSLAGAAGYDDFYKIRYRTAWKSYNDGLKNAVRLADRHKEVTYLISLSTLYQASGQLDSCRAYVARARTAAQGSAPLSLLADANAALFEKRPFDITEDKISSLEDSLPVYDLSALAVAGGRLALTAGSSDKALGLFKKAQKLLDKDKNSPGFANAAYWQARAEFKGNDSKTALATAERAAELFRKGEFVLGVRKSLKLQQEILTALGDTEKAAAVAALIARMPKE